MSGSYQGGELTLFEKAVHWKRYYARLLKPYLVGRVAEVGAGLGATTPFLCDGRQREWVCLEPDPALADVIAMKIAGGALPGICALQRCALRDLAAGERFDAIVYVDVLEHIADDAAEVRGAWDRLAAGGHVAVVAPAHAWLFSPFDRAIGHCRRYDRRGLRALAPAGAREVMMRYLDSCGLAASLGNKLLLRADYPTPRQLAFWDTVLVGASRVTDPLTGYRLGKSVVAVWRKDA